MHISLRISPMAKVKSIWRRSTETPSPNWRRSFFWPNSYSYEQFCSYISHVNRLYKRRFLLAPSALDLLTLTLTLIYKLIILIQFFHVLYIHQLRLPILEWCAIFCLWYQSPYFPLGLGQVFCYPNTRSRYPTRYLEVFTWVYSISICSSPSATFFSSNISFHV